jgi:UDP-N-acetylglucosamine acyltransferase
VAHDYKVHPTAIVAPEAVIGEGTEIGPYSIVGPKVRLGRGNKVGPHVVIEGRTTVGDENKIFQFASVGSVPQDLKYSGEDSSLIIGDRNLIREYVTLQPGTASGKMETTIGSENLFMVSSHVAHDCIVGDRNVLANSVAVAGHVEIGNGVVLGGLCGIHQFVRIGDLCMLAGGSMVNRDIPPFCTAQGDRALLVGLNLVGLERRGVDSHDMKMLRAIYRRLFEDEGALREKLEVLKGEYRDFELANALFDFISTSRRGVTRAKGRGSD